MSAWLLGLAAWLLLSSTAVFFVGRVLALVSAADERENPPLRPSAVVPSAGSERRRVVLVDDDPAFRALLSVTLASEELQLAEAGGAAEARDLVRLWKPDVVLLDVAMPGLDGISFCRELKARESAPIVVLVTGAKLERGAAAAAGADGLLTKPFSPLELLGVIDRLTGRAASAWISESTEADQLLLYARDLNSVLELERTQRKLIENAYRQTVTALATTLEARDTGTRVHSLRVMRYALALAGRHDPRLLSDPSLVYGFLLHDIGKIGVPDRILLKRGPLTPMERRIMRRHPVLGEEILGDVALLDGEGLKIVRSHHERWDGAGYPDGVTADAIPVGARIFAVADTLDAMTSQRPYRAPAPWQAAVREIRQEAGRQFDPDVVETFAAVEPELRGIFEQLNDWVPDSKPAKEEGYVQDDGGATWADRDLGRSDWSSLAGDRAR